MAKTMLSNLAAIAANTMTDNIKMIDIAELHESADNFFVVERVEEFAETILGQGGVKDNLIVRPLESGGYEIISGHRRRAAVQYLLDQGENVSRYLPCLVQEYADDSDRLLDIVLMNVSARQISDAEMWKSYEIVDKILKDKKSAGEKFGRVREKLAEILGVSPAQVGKMQNVDKNAIPAVKEAVESGDISISTASEIAKMDVEDQVELLEQTGFEGIKHKDVKAKNQSKPKTPKPKKSATSSTESVAEPVAEEVDTCSTFSSAADDFGVMDADMEMDADMDSAMEDAAETAEPVAEEVAEEVDTCSTISESKSPMDALASFVGEKMIELQTIFASYSSIGTEYEEDVLKQLLKLLNAIKK
ncbi:MAG: ParB N-terminal domain-containing protein [Ruminococcus sp.]|nr:ParB N-terminal domain-containing protein [Oscillospiraceae bacterium]MBQ6945850.1 ParB N-terminal domain-containing protein [Ruminococcus sp.]